MLIEDKQMYILHHIWYDRIGDLMVTCMPRVQNVVGLSTAEPRQGAEHAALKRKKKD